MNELNYVVFTRYYLQLINLQLINKEYSSPRELL